MKLLISAEEIDEAVRELGRKISADYRDRPLTVLGILTGSIILLADLVRAIDGPLRVGLIQAASYHGASTESGTLSISDEMLPDISGRDVLLVDDIFDTGRTLEALLERIGRKQPASLRSAVLLFKQGRQEVDVRPDYHCFEIPDAFVVGYGLDYDDEFRQLPYVAALEDADLNPPTGDRSD